MGPGYRTALAIVLLSGSAAAADAAPDTAAGGLAGSPRPTERAISHGPDLQAPEPAPLPPPVGVATIYAETQEQADMAIWATDRMAAAGLPLPATTIYLHTDRADCSSDPNRLLNGYYAQVDGENIVHSCGNRWTLLHELAHVWDKNYLDDEKRQLVLDHQGLKSWSHETWNQAGGEHLASIVAWALEGTHPTRIGYYDQQHLAAAYELATGSQPPPPRGDTVLQSIDTDMAIATLTAPAPTPDWD